MIEVYLSAIAVVLTIFGAAWRLSTLVATLNSSLETLTRTVDKLSTKLDDHKDLIVRHDEKIKNLENRIDEAA